MRKALGSPSKINFDESHNRHADAVAYLIPLSQNFTSEGEGRCNALFSLRQQPPPQCDLIGLSHLGTNTTGILRLRNPSIKSKKPRNLTWKWTCTWCGAARMEKRHGSRPDLS